jgi:hypothetical protein
LDELNPIPWDFAWITGDNIHMVFCLMKIWIIPLDIRMILTIDIWG